ncbi:hypothetical protein [Streptomyces himalayensis]|nr:hypothetical protein [Streptomyces himalayensis]
MAQTMIIVAGMVATRTPATAWDTRRISTVSARVLPKYSAA